MCLLQTRCDGRTRVTASIHDVFPVMVFGVVEQGFDAGLREGPGAGVEGFFLAPDDGFGVGVLVEVFFELLPGEGVELFDARDGSVFEAVVGAVFVQGGVDLACAEDYALDLLGLVDGFAVLGVGDDPFELGVAGELLDGGTGKGVSEEGLGEENDERFSELSVHLASQDVEQVGGSCHVSNLHVAVLVLTIKLVRRWEDARIFVTKLEISLHAARRMLGSLSIISVRQ